MLIEIDPKIIEEKLRAEFGPSYPENTILSEKISHSLSVTERFITSAIAELIWGS